MQAALLIGRCMQEKPDCFLQQLRLGGSSWSQPDFSRISFSGVTSLAAVG